MTRDDPELGTERRCSLCQEWWPDDIEFWYPSNKSWCRACFAEDLRRRRHATAHSR